MPGEAYQTFRGTSVEDALASVRAELGDDALIESTRTIAANADSGEPSTVEIVAARGSTNSRSPFAAATRPRLPSSLPSSSPSSSWGVSSSGRRKGRGDRIPESVAREIGDLRALVEELRASRPAQDAATQILKRAGFDGPIVAELTEGAERIASESLAPWLRGRIAARLELSPGLINGKGKRVIACVGPSGSGKTTTLAKLAARARLSLGKSVAVVSLDHFRVGAAEQWQRYADLLGIEFSLVAGGAALRDALDQDQNELVLIDTPSCGADSRNRVDGAARGLAEAMRCSPCSMDVLLVIPAWMKARDAWRVMAAHAEPSPTGMVISKVDETDQVGGALQVSLPYGIPISYLCDGPRVPEDIRDADADSILDAVLAVQS